MTGNDLNPCPACRSEDRATFSVGHIFVRHQDFIPLKTQPSCLSKCNACQMIYLGERVVIRELQEFFCNVDYARNKKTEHVVFQDRDVPGNILPTTYSFMVDFIDRHIKKKNGLRVLDIGCFDGKLLLELNRRYKDAVMHGFDVSKYIEEIFPVAENFRYFCEDFRRITDQYDLICVVNTLMYVDDLPSFMNTINRCLKPEGRLFLIVPNVQRNPYFLTLGDQYTYQTPANLLNFLHHCGYEADLTLDSPAFPRSILCMARKRQGKAEMISDLPDDTLQKSLGYLNTASASLKSAVARHKSEGAIGPRVLVLGSTHNAAWAQNILGDDVDFFVDENPSRVGRSFYGKKIMHPHELKPNDLLMVPYGETSRTIMEKFSRLYPSNLLMV